MKELMEELSEEIELREQAELAEEYEILLYNAIGYMAERMDFDKIAEYLGTDVERLDELGLIFYDEI